MSTGRCSAAPPTRRLASSPKPTRRFYGEPARPFDPNVLLETMCAYAERHIAAGGRLGHVTRHMVGLFHGLPGARRYRQILSVDATKPGAGPEVLRKAFAAVEFGADLEAA